MKFNSFFKNLYYIFLKGCNINTVWAKVLNKVTHKTVGSSSTNTS